MAAVSLAGIDKHYGTFQALSDVSLDIEDGEFAVFVGPSGCGKSTLLRSIAGLEPVSGGNISIGGTDVTSIAPSDRDVAMVFQSYALYPHMSVQDNMEFGMKVNGVSKHERVERVSEAAKILQLDSYLARKPAELSGGQRQRVAIGRAIVKDPKVFLFDEPLSNLDAKLRVQMRIELESLHKKLGATMIYVTHDQVEAMTMADKIVVLNEGAVEQIGKPLDLYHSPGTEFVAGFLGSPSMNILQVNVGNSGEVLLGDVVLTHCNKVAVKCGIRPEHIEIIPQSHNSLNARVHVVESLGGEAYIYCKVESTQADLVVKTDGDVSYKTDDSIGLSILTNHIHLFDSDGIAIPHDSVSSKPTSSSTQGV